MQLYHPFGVLANDVNAVLAYYHPFGIVMLLTSALTEAKPPPNKETIQRNRAGEFPNYPDQEGVDRCSWSLDQQHDPAGNVNDEQLSFSAAERAQPAIEAVCTAAQRRCIRADSAVPLRCYLLCLVRTLSGRLQKNLLYPLCLRATVLPLRKIKPNKMSYQNLLVTEEGPFLTVTINREKALNALNQQTMSDLAQFFGEDLPKRSGVRGVILTGAGDRAFVAGADIKEFTSLEGEGGANMAQRGQDVFFLIERSQVPVVAAIQGFALGGGCELAMACHLRIAGEKARFGQPEVNLGIIPGYGGTQRLIQYIGKTKATELMMTGDMLGAEDALRLGLVNYVVAPGEEVAKAKELLQKIATKGPRAIAQVIEAINAYFQYDEDGFANEVAGFGKVTQTEDFKEGAQAFVEKRAANFTGK